MNGGIRIRNVASWIQTLITQHMHTKPQLHLLCSFMAFFIQHCLCIRNARFTSTRAIKLYLTEETEGRIQMSGAVKCIMVREQTTVSQVSSGECECENQTVCNNATLQRQNTHTRVPHYKRLEIRMLTNILASVSHSTKFKHPVGSQTEHVGREDQDMKSSRKRQTC